jgi:hypothetical protein
MSVSDRSIQQVIDAMETIERGMLVEEAAAEDPFTKGDCHGQAHACRYATALLRGALNGAFEVKAGNPAPCKIIQFPVPGGRPRVQEEPIPVSLNREGYILLVWRLISYSGKEVPNGWYLPLSGPRWIYGAEEYEPWTSGMISRISRARVLRVLNEPRFLENNHPGPYGWEAIRILCAPGPDRRMEFLAEHEPGNTLLQK